MGNKFSSKKNNIQVLWCCRVHGMNIAQLVNTRPYISNHKIKGQQKHKHMYDVIFKANHKDVTIK